MSDWTVDRIVKVGDDWVRALAVVAVERRPGGSARIHLSSGVSITPPESMSPDDVMEKLFPKEVADV